MNNGNSANVTTTDSLSFNYKSILVGKSIVVNNNRNEIIEMILIFSHWLIVRFKLYVLIVTLSSKENVKLVKLLEEGFKRPVYWNEYQTKI